MTYGALASTQLVNSGRFDDAVARASAEIVAMPDEPEAYFNRAQALAALSRWEEAVADYEAALRLDPGASGLDPAAVDDELFFALRTVAVSRKADPSAALATLDRYAQLLPQGRHIDDLRTWSDHINGIDPLWYRDRV
jgi:tetratricopeptide (TPR) repeat protein